MNKDELKKLAEDHWKYTKGVIDRIDDRCVELAEYLYVQAWMHCHKHLMDEKDKAVTFVKHIEDHLRDMEELQHRDVMCKICEKTIDEIYEKERSCNVVKIKGKR